MSRHFSGGKIDDPMPFAMSPSQSSSTELFVYMSNGIMVVVDGCDARFCIFAEVRMYLCDSFFSMLALNRCFVCACGVLICLMFRFTGNVGHFRSASIVIGCSAGRVVHFIFMLSGCLYLISIFYTNIYISFFFFYLRFLMRNIHMPDDKRHAIISPRIDFWSHKLAATVISVNDNNDN